MLSVLSDEAYYSFAERVADKIQRCRDMLAVYSFDLSAVMTWDEQPGVNAVSERQTEGYSMCDPTY